MNSMIEVLFSNPHDFPVREAGVENTVSRVFLTHDITIAEIGIHIVDEAEMTELNENYKHHQGSTDVLTFPMHDPEQPTPHFLETEATQQAYGDIFLCYPVIEQEAQEREISTQEQIEFLAEHGCLHLLGVHHD